MRSKYLLIVSVLFIVFCALIIPSSSQAASKTSINVTVISASNSGYGKDESLDDLQEDLNNLFTYSYYEKLKDIKLSLATGEKEVTNLPLKRVLEIEKTGENRRRVKVTVRIKEKGKYLLDTDFAIVKGGTLLVGGPSYEDGVLILAIHVAK